MRIAVNLVSTIAVIAAERMGYSMDIRLAVERILQEYLLSLIDEKSC